MEKLISVAVMRASDAAEIAGGTDSKTLMYRAGLGLFQSWDWHGKIDIVTGSGNNAGDGYVLALLLRQHGLTCRIVRRIAVRTKYRISSMAWSFSFSTASWDCFSFHRYSPNSRITSAQPLQKCR